jgi:serine phosphatase RsbU (regulator of sigma subunit)
MQVIESNAELARTVVRLLESEERLTAALVATQDRMAALRALIEVPIDSLDDNIAITLMLDEALELTDSDGAVLRRGDSTVLVGAAAMTAELGHRLGDLAPDMDQQPHPIDFPYGAAVVAALRDVDGPAALGFTRNSGGHYSTGDLQLVDAVVAATEKLLTLTRMHRLGVQQAAVEREHQMASSLAQAILPAATPVLDGVDVFAETIPARLAGGDFYTFDVLDGVLWIAVGDVAGKGLPAAIVMTRAVSAARVAFHTHAENDPAGALAAVGDELFDYLHAVGLFVTMALGAYRPGSGILHLCNAGHSPVLTMTRRRTSSVPPTTPPVGVLLGVKGRTQAIPFEFGSALVLGSDGLTEQEDPAGALYGYERFERKLIEFSNLSLPNMGARLIEDVRQYAEGTPPSDDRTLVLLRGIA